MNPRYEVGPYEVLRRLGAGGMAETFLARRESPLGIAQYVCLKRVLPAFERDREIARLFLREARISSRLRHGNIVRVLDFGETDDAVPYLVLSLVDGLDLRTLLAAEQGRGERLPADVVLYIAGEVAAALDFAHAIGADGITRGVLHRDVSPSNVLLDRNGDVKLGDFGVAKAVGEAGLTGTRAVRGKLAYMAPEYAEHGRFDERSDLFALGVVLYECLAGERPFDAPNEPRLMELIREGRFVPLGARRPEAPAALRDAIERLLRTDPSARFATARAFLDALDPCRVPVGGRRELADRVCRELPRSLLDTLPPAPPERPAAKERGTDPTAALPGRPAPPDPDPQPSAAPPDAETRTRRRER